jgi:tetratricopeptide (TPR) repeat protein
MADQRLPIPIRDSLLATRRNEAAIFISREVDRIIDSQLAIAENQEEISSALSDVSYEMSRIGEGLEEMTAAIEWGFGELARQMERQRDVLNRILERIEAPLDTQARELKKRALNAYKNGWFDEALEDFLEAEKKNRYDFTIHQSIGNIYFLRKHDTVRAVEYYEKAFKYALPESPYYASYAKLHIGLVRYLGGDFEAAYEATKWAVNSSSDIPEAHFQHAKNCAKLKKHDEAVQHLRSAIAGDQSYCVKISHEPDFADMQSEVKTLFERLRAGARKIADREFSFAESSMQESIDAGVESDRVSRWRKRLAKLRHESSEKDSVFDYWGAAEQAFYLERDIAAETTKDLSDVISSLRPRVESLSYKAKGWKTLMDGTTWMKVTFWLGTGGFALLEFQRGDAFSFWYSTIGLYVALAIVAFLQSRYFRIRKLGVVRHTERSENALVKFRDREKLLESRIKDATLLRAKVVGDTLGMW